MQYNLIAKCERLMHNVDANHKTTPLGLGCVCHVTVTPAGTPRLHWNVAVTVTPAGTPRLHWNHWHQQEHRVLGCVTTHWHQQEHRVLGCVTTHWHQQEHRVLGCVTTHWHQQEHRVLGCVTTHWHQQEHRVLGCVTHSDTNKNTKPITSKHR